MSQSEFGLIHPVDVDSVPPRNAINLAEKLQDMSVESSRQTVLTMFEIIKELATVAAGRGFHGFGSFAGATPDSPQKKLIHTLFDLANNYGWCVEELETLIKAEGCYVKLLLDPFVITFWFTKDGKVPEVVHHF